MRAPPQSLSAFLLLLVVGLGTAGCESGGPLVLQPDTHPECMYDQDCDSRDCSDGHCVDICAGVAHGVVCTSYDSADCCGEDSICCYSGFEHMSCFPAATGCPVVCPRTTADRCDNGQTCAYALEDLPPTGMCGYASHTTCVDACPVEQQCGSASEPMCCGTGTSCVDGCCVRPVGDPPDGGVPDGGAPDAS